MTPSLLPTSDYFTVRLETGGIVAIQPADQLQTGRFSTIMILEEFAALLTSLTASKQIAGIIYTCPLTDASTTYTGLFQQAAESDFKPRICSLLALSASISQSVVPVIAFIDRALNSIQLAPMLWSRSVILQDGVKIRFPDAGWGTFPGLGATTYAVRRLSVDGAASLLVRGASFDAKQALDSGLIQQTVQDKKAVLPLAAEWIRTSMPGTGDRQDIITAEDIARQLTGFKKKVNPRFPGVQACFELIEASKSRSLRELLDLEADKYAAVLQNPVAKAMMRTLHKGVQNAQRSRAAGQEIAFRKIGIIGAGMMGSGIAYEVALAGMKACLKDTTVELAMRGKQYSEKCCDKLIALGKMTDSKKEAILSLIHPTDNVADLKGADLIIEAVFEQEALKAAVIEQSEPLLKKGGIFASNTTSLPISRLAGHSRYPERFIGMHFFSPVDRMPLVEIILGKQTSQATVDAAVALALRLQKIPIIVHDSPAFFTSRIFFNYLLEAITMVLEGIPAASVEKEALNAGFAVSPLAVLDEISLPLMVHVYDQLPQLSHSQQRCYDYLRMLIAAGREGRKAGKGFYDYDPATSKKQILEDETIQHSTVPVRAELIQKRLLHVMALDSYRCLEEGVLDRPIDGDIGSIMGVGYAAHTGGVISHIDQVGLNTFIKDCDSFQEYGAQWDIPDRLRTLAKQHYRFYNDFSTNWPPNDKS